MSRTSLAERLMLAVSGAAFLLMNVPTQTSVIVGMLGCIVLLGLMILFIPAMSANLRQVLRSPGSLAAGALVSFAFSSNFYDTWGITSTMDRIASLVRLSGEQLSVGIIAVMVLVSAPAVGCVLTHYAKIGRELWNQGENTGRFSAGTSLLLLSGAYALGLWALIRANYYYLDDIGRATYGYKHWGYFSRYFSCAFANYVHMDFYLADAAPLPQLLAGCLMAAAGVLVLRILTGRRRFSGWELAAMVPLALNPYFLECFSYRFDAPYMAVSVLVCVLPLLYRDEKPLSYIGITAIGTVLMCSSYQASSGVFPLLTVVLALQMWNRKENWNGILRFVIRSVAGYGIGLVFFKLALMHDADAGYVANTMPGLTSILPHALGNLKTYYTVIGKDFKLLWLVLLAAVGVGACFHSVRSSKQGTAASVAMALLALGLMLLLTFGLYPLLSVTLFNPRAMYGFGILIAVLGVLAVQETAIASRLPAVLLSWCFFVFAFTYGNALDVQQEYTDYRMQAVIHDLNDLECFCDGAPKTIRFTGSIGQAPSLRNMPQNYEILNRLVPETFGGGDDWSYMRFFNFYNLPNISPDTSEDDSAWNLPLLEDHMLHSIYGDGSQFLIALK